jgi:uncharacterized protein
MSDGNVEHVRRVMEHWLRTGEGLWGDLDPELEVHDYDIPDGGVYRGHEGLREWLAHFGEAFESWAFEPREYIDAGDGRVVVVGRLSAQGKGSGVSVDRLDAMAWTVRDGKALRLDYYNSRAEALDAAGLRD